MTRFIALAVVLVALIALPVYAQQSGLTLEGVSSRIDVLFAGQTYLTQRIAALETTVAISSQRQVVALPTSTHTPVPPSPTQTFTPIPTPIPQPTETATMEPSATPTPRPAQAMVVVNRRATIRRGPGNSHAVIAMADEDDEFSVLGKNLNKTWWQIEYEGSPAWISNSYVEAYGIADVQVAATPTRLVSPTPAETATPVPTATMETIGQEIWGRLMEVARADIAGADEDEDDYSLEDVITKYFDLLADLEPLCELTKIEIIDLVEPHAQRIDDSGISEQTGYWARWSLLGGMKTYLSENEAVCSEYIRDYAAWVIVKYGDEE